MRLTRDFLFVDLLNKLNSLTFRSRHLVKFDMNRGIKQFNNTIHDKTKSRIICLAKNQGHLTNYQFLMKRTQKIWSQTMDKTMAKPAGVVKNA